MNTPSQSNTWSIRQSVTLAVIAFVLGCAIGYIAHAPASAPQPVTASAPNMQMPPAQSAPAAPAIEQSQVSPEQMKAASVKAAGTVLDKLKADPKNYKLLVEAGEMYFHHGSYAEAGSYYSRALAVQDEPAVRNRYASTLFYTGDIDGALKQYDAVLAKQPKNDVALFNEGMILYKSKNDRARAIESWKKLLAAYPNHPQKDQVQKMIDSASKQG